MSLRRHSWSDPHRELRHTDRCCWHCGLVKRTRHEGDRTWVEFVDNGVVVARPGSPTPECPGPKAQGPLDFNPKATLSNGDSHETDH